MKKLNRARLAGLGCRWVKARVLKLSNIKNLGSTIHQSSRCLRRSFIHMVVEGQRGDTTSKEVKDKTDEVEEEIEDQDQIIVEVSVVAETKVSKTRSRTSEEISKSTPIPTSACITKTILNSTSMLSAKKTHPMSSKFTSSLITIENNPEMRPLLQPMRIRRRKKNSSNHLGLLH